MSRLNDSAFQLINKYFISPQNTEDHGGTVNGEWHGSSAYAEASASGRRSQPMADCGLEAEGGGQKAKGRRLEGSYDAEIRLNEVEE